MSAERRVEKEKEIQLMEQRVQQFNMEKLALMVEKYIESKSAFCSSSSKNSRSN